MHVLRVTTHIEKESWDNMEQADTGRKWYYISDTCDENDLVIGGTLL